MIETELPRNVQRAVEAASGAKRGVLVVGPPGSGKFLLARALHDRLPPLSDSEALEIGLIHQASWIGGDELPTQRPFRAPHHTVSEAGLLGGGHKQPRPGEVSLAHGGLLVLDELPEFRRSTIDQLTHALRDGASLIHRSETFWSFPARPLLVVATANPCPCGFRGTARGCRCPASSIRRYAERTEALADYLDVRVELEAPSFHDVSNPARA